MTCPYVGKRIQVMVDGRVIEGVVRNPSPKYPYYPRVLYTLNGESEVRPFHEDAIRRAVEEKEILLA